MATPSLTVAKSRGWRVRLATSLDRTSLTVLGTGTVALVFALVMTLRGA